MADMSRTVPVLCIESLALTLVPRGSASFNRMTFDLSTDVCKRDRVRISTAVRQDRHEQGKDVGRHAMHPMGERPVFI